MSRVYGRFTIPCEGLQPGSQPTEDELRDVDIIDKRRRLLCQRYENCLTYAASLNWSGFHCCACTIDEPTPGKLGNFPTP